MDSQHPGDSFRRSFSPRSSFSDQIKWIFVVLEYLELDSGILGSSGAILGVLPETLGARIGPCGRPSGALQPNIKEITRFQYSQGSPVRWCPSELNAT